MSTVDSLFAAFFFCFCSLMGGVVSHALKPHVVFSGHHRDEAAFNDIAGRPRLAFDAGGGEPEEKLLGVDHLPRLQLGLEGNPGPVPAEAPYLKLSNNRGELRMAYRLDGPNESPVITMKDRQGRDRVVLGLDPKDPAQEPYLALYDTQGHANVVFGTAP